MTTILKTVVLPTNWLSLSVGAVSGATNYRVGVTPTDGPETVINVAPSERLRVFETQYLQRVVKLIKGATYTVRVAADVGDVLGYWGAPSTVTHNVSFSDLRRLRQVVHEALGASGITVNGEAVTVVGDRFGFPRVLKGAPGVKGPVVAVGVTYGSESTINDPADMDYAVTVPIRVTVKADEEEDGQDAADVAELVRNKLSGIEWDRHGMDRSPTWSIQAPEQREKLIEVQMEINLRGFRDPEANC